MTYSIVARDPHTGDVGVALQSHWFQAPSGAIWARAGVGAVATQADSEPSYGPLGLDRIQAGASPRESLDELLGRDDRRDHRQVALIDVRGRIAVHTGSSCIREAGHVAGDGFSAQANMMWKDAVWGAMASAFESSVGDLSDRLLAALDAAEAAGGDIRGRQSAGVMIVRAEPTERPWSDTLMDIEVADHPRPLEELRRLVELRHAYDMIEDEPARDDSDGALRRSLDAMESAPGSAEIAFWTAVELAVHGRIDEARRAFTTCRSDGEGWSALLRRLGRDGQANMTTELADSITSPDEV